MKTITTILAVAIALSATTAHANPYFKYKAWNQNKKDRIEAAVSIADLESFSGSVPTVSGTVSNNVVAITTKSALNQVLTDEAQASLTGSEYIVKARITLNGEILTHDNDIIETVTLDNGFGGTYEVNHGIAAVVNLGQTITYSTLAEVAEDLATLAAEAAYQVGYDDGYSDGYKDGWNARGAAIAAELNCTWCD